MQNTTNESKNNDSIFIVAICFCVVALILAILFHIDETDKKCANGNRLVCSDMSYHKYYSEEALSKGYVHEIGKRTYAVKRLPKNGEKVESAYCEISGDMKSGLKEGDKVVVDPYYGLSVGKCHSVKKIEN